MYLSGYWEYRTFRANRLPSLTLDVTPAQYNRDITKRYDSGQDLDVYRTQQSYYASVDFETNAEPLYNKSFKPTILSVTFQPGFGCC